MALESDASSQLTSNPPENKEKKPKFNKLFCWKKKPSSKCDKNPPCKRAPSCSTLSDSSIPPRKRSVQFPNSDEKGTTTENQTQVPGRKDSKSQASGDQSVGGGGGDGKVEQTGHSEGKRCEKCSKRKSKSSQKDRKSCKCRSGGYCNTNTIIFPNEFRHPSVETQENKYFELLKEIIKDETKKNCTGIYDFRREMDKQREEIRELKNLLLQHLLYKDNKDNKDNKENKDSNDSFNRNTEEHRKDQHSNAYGQKNVSVKPYRHSSSREGSSHSEIGGQSPNVYSTKYDDRGAKTNSFNRSEGVKKEEKDVQVEKDKSTGFFGGFMNKFSKKK